MTLSPEKCHNIHGFLYAILPRTKFILSYDRTKMALIRRGSTKRESKVYYTRIPAEDGDKLDSKHPNRGEVAHVLRALVQRYLEGKITDLSYTRTEVI